MNWRLTQRGALRTLGILSSVTLMTLTGCGFQLKGTDSNTAQLQGLTIRLVSGQPRAELTREVTRELTANGLVLRDVFDTDLSLRLEPEQFTQRNVSLTAQARAAELELTLSAAFSFAKSEQEPINARASVNRQMLNDPRNIVGKTEELRLLRQEMRRDLAAQIVRRVSHSLAN